MIHSVRFTAVLDTNVIYPVQVRDILFWFAYYNFYTPKWSKHIFDEWGEVMRRKGVSEKEIVKRMTWPDIAFPDALVTNYQNLIDKIKLNDPNDRHVLAAAIKSNANLIVTNNLKHFPGQTLKTYGLHAISPDNFLVDLIDLNQKTAVEAFSKMVFNRKSPSMDKYDVLEALRRNGLTQTADYLYSQI